MVSLLVALPALAQDAAQKKQLKLDLAPGAEVAFDEAMTFALDMKMDMGAAGNMNVQQTIEAKSAGTVSVLEVADGVPTKVRVTFSPDSGTTTTTMGQATPVPFPLAGRVVTVTRAAGAPSASAQVTAEPPVQIDEATRQQVAELMDFDRAMLPETPVGVGDTWQPGAAAMGQMMPGMTPQATLRLTGFGEQQGRAVAQVQSEMSASGAMAEMGGAQMTLKASGPIVIDVATGVPLSGQMSGDMTMKGQVQQGGMSLNVDGTGQIKVNSTNRISGGGTPGAGAAQAAGGGPDAGASAQPSAAQKYAGDGLNVSVADDDTVAITMGGQTYPGRVTSRGDDGSMKGQFTANGGTFDFTAKVSGETMTLESGGKSYTLKQEGEAKPPAAPNPLGGN